jgi:hypothetical protein
MDDIDESESSSLSNSNETSKDSVQESSSSETETVVESSSSEDLNDDETSSSSQEQEEEKSPILIPDDETLVEERLILIPDDEALVEERLRIVSEETVPSSLLASSSSNPLFDFGQLTSSDSKMSPQLQVVGILTLIFTLLMITNLIFWRQCFRHLDAQSESVQAIHSPLVEGMSARKAESKKDK